MASNEYAAEMSEITATLVGEADRLRVLPQYCGARYMMVVENSIYTWMRWLDSSYTGGMWDFYELSNGGFFMAPHGVQTCNISAQNMYSGTMSAEAAGITVTLYALNFVANHHPQQHLIDLYHALRAYATRHFEWPAICAAID